MPRPFIHLLVGLWLWLPLSIGSAEPPEGFVDLLAGEGLEGWVVEPDSRHTALEAAKPTWTRQDGELHCDGRGEGFLRYDRRVCDFVLRLEYRIAPRGNSGVGIRGIPHDGSFQSRPSVQAYEVQILDDAGRPANVHSTGSLYRYVAPLENAARPAEQWNRMEIECVGPRIRITLNGTLIQDVDQSERESIRDKPLCGYILLQNHASRVAFRNVHLKVLD